MNWTSSINGFIGNSDEFSYNSSNLDVGTHTITFNAIDSINESTKNKLNIPNEINENKAETKHLNSILQSSILGDILCLKTEPRK